MPVAPDLSGHALDGRYELHAIIGEGAFGRVYRGRDRRLARWVAVKVIKPWWAEDPEWARSFEREAQLLASISDPGIIQIFDVGAAPEGLYYVAELVEGESLAYRLRRGPLAPDTACRIALHLAGALGRAHAQHVIHRDVKPANVLLSRDGRIKVGDFGVARLASGSSDGVAGTIAGTPPYMAPEQAAGGVVTPATDVYGVGVVLYEMLAGHTPFAGTSAIELALRHVNDPPPALPPSTAPSVAAIVDRALAKDPAERYRDGRELASALARARTRLATEERPAAAGKPRATIAASAFGGDSASSTTQVIELAPPRSEAGDTPSALDNPLRVAKADAPSLVDNPPRVAATKTAQPRPPRRNFNPPERRQRIALLIFAVLLAAGMGAGAIVLAPGHLRVPNLRGMTKSRVIALSRRDGFHASFGGRYSGQPVDTAIGQDPVPGTRVGDGATIQVVLSRGPRPVQVPQLVGSSSQFAQSSLRDLKLRATITQVPAPRVTTGTIARQVPAAGASLRPGSTVALYAAEPPRLRPLTGLSGDGAGRSVPFRISGSRWEIAYSMGYQGMCTFIVFCSGPSAKVINTATGATVDHFDLGEGSNETRIFKSGPGVYELVVSPGSDTAAWKIQVDDYY